MVSSSTSIVLASLPLLALAAVFVVVTNSEPGSLSQCLTHVKLFCVTGQGKVETCAFNQCINVRTAVLMNVALSVLCYVGCIRLIPRMRKYMIKAGLSGKDLNKHGAKEDKPDVPEALGLIPGVIYLIAIIFCQLLFGTGGNRAILVEYNAALHSIGFMIFLGFVDDVVDLPWRYKLIIPAVASLPLLVAYGGGTSIIIPLPFRFLLGKTIDLGILYQLYMLLLSIFCTNSINIFAGINGLEAGQSFVIAVAVAIHNIMELSGPASPSSNAHLFSLLLILPFIAVTLGLLKYNWYPSEVFVGDTFTTFAGMTFAVVGILGHFSKTLLLFFIPQLINFLYSLPQILHLFGLTCPRHRLPKFNQQTGKLEGVRSHHNLVNLFLLISGPLREDHLCIALMFFQAVCCCIGFAVRYKIANYFY